MLIQTLDELSERYKKFIQKKDCPQISTLTNWGRNRCFIAENFHIKQCLYLDKIIFIEFNSKIHQLNTTNAPDFMNQTLYIHWLQQQLLKQ